MNLKSFEKQQRRNNHSQGTAQVFSLRGRYFIILTLLVNDQESVDFTDT